IDPADLYNVTIRPVGQTRFEIILPTGGAHQAAIEEQAWEGLLADVKNNPAWNDRLADVKLDVPRGRDRELILQVQQALNWETLKDKLREKYPVLKEKPELLNAVPVGQTQKLIDVIKEPTKATPEELRKFIDENAQTVKEDEVRSFVESRYQAGGRKNVTGEE